MKEQTNSTYEIVKTMTKEDTKKLYDTYSKLGGYSETPPTIEEFITNDFYLGKSLDNGRAVYPYWKKILVDIFPTPFFESNKYKVLMFSGGTGIGKSTVASIIQLYDLARTLCLSSPQEKFRLPKSAKIYFMMTNSTLENAETINLDPMISLIRDSAFFRSKFSTDQRKNMFINNIDLGVISRKRSLVGKNVLSAQSDEINVEVTKGGSKELVIEMYNRINSRFILPGNQWPGHYCLISSAATESSLINTLMENDAEKSDVLVISAPRFEVKGHLGSYCGEEFDIFIGDYQSDPFIISTEEERVRAKRLDSTKIRSCPIEHKYEFETDIYAGIRDVLGMAVSDVRTFMPFKDKIGSSLQLTRLCELDEVTISSDDDGKLINFFNKDILDSFKPGSQKVIGIDVAISGDRLGIAMAHIHELRDLEHFNPEQQQLESSSEQVYWVDFAIGVKPPKGQQLPLYKIREFVYDLKKAGVNVSLIVMDTFQSYDMMQIFKKQGFDALLHSVDRKKDAYQMYRNCINENRIKQPNNQILFKELTYLQEDEKKVDHPDSNPDGTIGSKDIADAVCNALYMCHEKLEYNPFEDGRFRDELLEASGEGDSATIFGEDVGFKSAGDIFGNMN